MEGATMELFLPCQGWARRLQLQTEAGLGTLSTSWHWLLSLTASEGSHWQTQDHKPPIWIPRLKCSLSLWLLHPRKTNFSSQDIWLWASESTSQTTVLRHSSAQDKQLSYSSPHLLWLLITHSKRTPVILLVSKCVIIQVYVILLLYTWCSSALWCDCVSLIMFTVYACHCFILVQISSCILLLRISSFV